MATIYKRQTGKGSYRYYINWADPETGRRYRQPIGENKAEAERVLADLNYKLAHNKLKRYTGITLNGFINQFITQYATPRKTKAGLERDTYIFEHLLNFFGDEKPAEQIGLAEMDAYVAFRKAKGIASSTINRELNTIKRMFVWGAKTGRICENNIRDYERLPVPESGSKYLTREQISLLLTSTTPEFTRFILFILYTGCRITKALELTWGEIDFDLGIIQVVNVKTRRQVIIPLADDIKGVLGEYKAEIKPSESDRLFPWAYNAIRSRWARLRRRLGLTGHTLNSLRHTFATYASMTSRDQLGTSRAMGHSSLATTGIYTGIPVERLREVVAGLNFLPTVTKTVTPPI